MKRIVVISDTQLPFDDRRALRALIQFIGDWQPDQVIHIGDVMDFPQPSRWNKDTAGEFQGCVFRDCEDAKRRFLDPLRKVYQGPVGFHEGNHDERPRTYLSKYAPALAGSKAFHIENLLDFDGFGIELLPEFNNIGNGWITTHGHLGGISLSRYAGHTALGAAVKFGSSVVMGHTHRLGLVPQSFGFDSRVTKTVHGFEVGNLMDMRKAHYLKGAAGNWQQGFGVLYLDGKHLKPEPVLVEKGKFVVAGNSWEV